MIAVSKCKNCGAEKGNTIFASEVKVMGRLEPANLCGSCLLEGVEKNMVVFE